MEPERSCPERGNAGYGWGLAIGMIIGLVAASFLTLYIRAGFRRIFADFGADLPRVTQCVMAIPWPVMVCVFLIPGLWHIVKDSVIRNERVREWCTFGVWCAFAAWLAILGFSLYHALVVLIMGIQ